MPIYEIVYQSSAPPVCGSGTSVTVYLVQDDVAMHPDAGSTSEYVDYVNVYYQPEENQQFVLILHDPEHDYELGKPDYVVSEGSEREAAEHVGTNPTSTGYEASFSAPTGTPSTTTFEFGAGTPPEKIKVKIKKQEDAGPCPQ